MEDDAKPPAGLGGTGLALKPAKPAASRQHTQTQSRSAAAPQSQVPQPASGSDAQPAQPHEAPVGSGDGRQLPPGMLGMASQMMRDPDALMAQMRQRLAASPLAQKAAADPSFMRGVMAANPALAGMLEGNPRLKQLLTSPDAIQGILSGDTTRMQQALGDGGDLQQHLQTAASLGAYAQQLRAQQAGGGGSVSSTTHGGLPAASAEPPQPNGAGLGTHSGGIWGAVLPAPGQQFPGGSVHAASSSNPGTASSNGFGAVPPTPQHQSQGLTHPPPPGHHAWRVTADRKPQPGNGGGGGHLQGVLPGTAAPNGGPTLRPGRLPSPSPAAAAPKFPIDYSPLPAASSAQAAHYVAPRRFFSDPSGEIQPADDPPEPPTRFLHLPGPGFGGDYRGGHGSSVPHRRGETYAQVCSHDDHGAHAPRVPLEELRRKARVPYADAAYPPLYIAVIAGLLWMLPLWAVLLLMVPIFVAGVNFIVMKLGGVPAKAVGASRLVASLIFSLEAVSTAFFLVSLAPALPQRRLSSMLGILCITVSMSLHWRVMFGIPGFAPLAHEYPGGEEAPVETHMGPCNDCRILRPLRSKHCFVCNRCVLQMDHHCPVVNNCVGAANSKHFLLYMMTMLPAQIVFVAACKAVLGMASQRSAWAAATLHPGMAVLAAIQVFLVAANGFLIARMLLCIAGSLHTAELLRWERYSYLMEPGNAGAFDNLFDRGPVINCIQFWGSWGPVDWGPIYYERWQAKQVGDEAPWCSVTSLMRAKQSMHSALRGRPVAGASTAPGSGSGTAYGPLAD